MAPYRTALVPEARVATCRRWDKGGAGIDREEQPGIAQMGVQLLSRNAGLDAAIHVGLADVDDAGHTRQVEGDPAAHRSDMAFERGAGTPRHHWHTLRVAESQEPGRLVGGLEERDRVGQDRWLGILAMRMMVPQRRVRGDAIGKERAGGLDDGLHGLVATGDVLHEPGSFLVRVTAKHWAVGHGLASCDARCGADRGGRGLAGDVAVLGNS